MSDTLIPDYDKREVMIQPHLQRQRAAFRSPKSSQQFNLEMEQIRYDISNLRSKLEVFREMLEDQMNFFFSEQDTADQIIPDIFSAGVVQLALSPHLHSKIVDENEFSLIFDITLPTTLAGTTSPLFTLGQGGAVFFSLVSSSTEDLSVVVSGDLISPSAPPISHSFPDAYSAFLGQRILMGLTFTASTSEIEIFSDTGSGWVSEDSHVDSSRDILPFEDNLEIILGSTFAHASLRDGGIIHSFQLLAGDLASDTVLLHHEGSTKPAMADFFGRVQKLHNRVRRLEIQEGLRR